MKNRIVAFLLTIAICCGLFSVVAFADAVEGYKYVIVKQEANEEGTYDIVDSSDNSFQAGSGKRTNVGLYYGKINAQNQVEKVDQFSDMIVVDGTKVDNYGDVLVGDTNAKNNKQVLYFEKKNADTGARDKYVVVFQEHCGHDEDGYGYTYKYKDEKGHTKACEHCLYSDGKVEAHDGKAETDVKESHTFTCSKCEESVTVPHSDTIKANGYCPDCKYAETTDVKFETGEGSKVADVTGVKCGDLLTKPKDPTWTGHKFGIWLKPDGTEFDFAKDKVTLNLVLTAKWDENSFKITTECDETKGSVRYSPALDKDGKMAAGTPVTVFVTVKDSDKYAVKSITIDGGDPVTSAMADFTMPEHDVTVKVDFKNVTGGGGGGTTEAPKYDISVNYGTGGRAEANRSTAKAGDSVELTTSPRSGWTVNKVYINGDEWKDYPADGDKSVTATFDMPDESVTIDVTFKELGKPGYELEDKVEQGKNETTVENGGDNADEYAKSSVTLPKAQASTLAISASKRLLEEAKRLLNASDDEAEKITFIARPQLTMTILRAGKPSENAPFLRMDIEGFIQMFARLGDKEEPLKDAKELMKETVTLRVALPGFTRDTAYVAHKGYEYTATEDNGLFKFRNPHGFSLFEFSEKSNAVASIDRFSDFKYLTFAKAAEETQKGDTLRILDDCSDDLRLPSGVTVRLENDAEFTGSINGVRKPFKDGDVVYRVDTDGRGSGSGSSGNGANGKPSVVPGAGGTAPVEPGNPRSRFLDVAYGAFYFDAVEWAATNGITKGKDTGYFAPNDSCTRAEMVTFLWRAAGSPEPTTSSAKFTDVEAGKYYEKAVAWAVEKGITQGVSATSFAPNATVTRDQTVTFIYRSKGSPAANGGSSFSDVPANAYYANAVAWAVQAGVTNGTSATTFSPAKNCTRGEIVTFLYRSK